jgi:hypothetical protein
MELPLSCSSPAVVVAATTEPWQCLVVVPLAEEDQAREQVATVGSCLNVFGHHCGVSGVARVAAPTYAREPLELPSDIGMS